MLLTGAALIKALANASVAVHKSIKSFFTRGRTFIGRPWKAGFFLTMTLRASRMMG